MKVSGISWFSEFTQELAKLLRMGNGLIAHTGEPRYTATKSGPRITLEKGCLHTIIAKKDHVEITVHSGTFWVTQENDAKDYLLKTGEKLVFTSSGKVIIEALQPGEFEIV
ncbi:MAG TPA: DUF2917 domain-containing protein [Verrucomicrobiae bacterium]